MVALWEIKQHLLAAEFIGEHSFPKCIHIFCIYLLIWFLYPLRIQMTFDSAGPGVSARSKYKAD